MDKRTTSPQCGSDARRTQLLRRPLLRLLLLTAVVVACVAAAFGIAQAATRGTNHKGQVRRAAMAPAATAWGVQSGKASGMGFGGRFFAARPLAAGSVQTVDQTAQSFTMKTLRGETLTVTTDSATVYKKPGATSASFADVTTGEKVLVMGGKASDGSLAAKTIIVAPKGFGRRWLAARPLAAGSVQSVDQNAKSFTLKTLRGTTLTVTTSDATVYKKPGATSASFGDVTTGEKVLVMGTKANDGSLAAKTIIVAPKSFRRRWFGWGRTLHGFRFPTPTGPGSQAVTPQI